MQPTHKISTPTNDSINPKQHNMKHPVLLSLTLTITSLLFSIPSTLADAPAIGSVITDTFYVKNIGADTAKFTLRRGDWSKSSWNGSSDKKFDNLMYRRNVASGSDGTWKNVFASSSTVKALNFKVAPGDSVSFYNTSGQLSTGNDYCINFAVNTADASFEVGGDLMTLVNTTYMQKAPDYSFVYLFKEFTTLTKSDRLKISARSVGVGSCENMFSGCTNLDGTSMDMSAITDTVYREAFKETFKECTQLDTVASLPQADTIGNRGCYQMFYNCSTLVEVKSHLPAKHLGYEALGSMFSVCQMLEKGPNIYATSLGTSACSFMFNQCSALVNGPDTLRAKHLPNAAYYGMFSNCVALLKSPVILATSMSNATAAAEGALAHMFYSGGGMALNTIECRLSGWFPHLNTTYYSTYNWLYCGPNSGTFICSQDLVSDGNPVYSETRIPKSDTHKWTIQYYPKVTFRVSKDCSGNATEGGWSASSTDTVSITQDWYGDPGQSLPTPWHATKDFRGWVDAEGNRITESSSILARTTHPTTTNITLYADFAGSTNLDLLDNQLDSYYDDLIANQSGKTLPQVTLKKNFWSRVWTAFNVPFNFFIPTTHPFCGHIYRFTGADGNAEDGFNIHFEGEVYRLDAGVPYLYYSNGKDLVDPIFVTDEYNNIVIDAEALNAANAKYDGDELVNTSHSRFQATVRKTALTGGDQSIIFLYGNHLYYPHANGNTMRAFCGYFKVGAQTPGVAPRIKMMVNGEQTNVQIEEFGADGEAHQTETIRKYIQDGTLVIERNGIRYDAQGHKRN